MTLSSSANIFAMSKPQPVPTLVIYRPKKGKESELQSVVEGHWPVLDRLGLVTKEPARIWRATDKRDPASIYFVEVFAWKDEKAPDTAHQTPEVMAVWETMGSILERLELARLEPLTLRAK